MMIFALRILILLIVLYNSVNHGVEAGRDVNPGWGTVWGILFFIFWMIVANVTLSILINVRRKINKWMDDNTY